MKKIITLTTLILFLSSLFANAVEMKVSGTGYAPLTGYDIKNVRSRQDSKMKKKAENSTFEVAQTQQIKEATRQAETRKKQDARLNDALRRQVIVEAQNNALKAAINILIDRTLGKNASSNPEVQAKYEDILSQADSYILDKKYTGEVVDNEYVSKVTLTVDETEFKEIISDLGVALYTQDTRAHSILIVLDEFFAPPSNLNQSTATKEVTTYKYDQKVKDTEKEALKAASSGQYAAAGYYSKVGSTSKSGLSYGKFNEYTNNISEFYQHIKEYAPTNPKVKGLNSTLPAMSRVFAKNDLNVLSNDIFKQKYFKGKPITSDILRNSVEIVGYVEAARKDAKADYFAIGNSYIVDNGKDESTGRNICSGTVDITVYSTVDNEIIAAGEFSEIASGVNPDNARAEVAKKMGEELAEEISHLIQNYWKKRNMYGLEYIVQIKGNFIPVERIAIRQAMEKTNGLKITNQRSSDSTLMEFRINYSGNGSVGDEIFMNLYNSSLSGKFKNYDYKTVGNQLIFMPIAKKGVSNL